MSKKKYTIELSKEAYKDLKRLAIAVYGTEIKKKDVLEHVENVIFDSVIDLEDKLERKPKPTKQTWEIKEAEKVEKLKKFAKDNGIDDPIIDILEQSHDLRPYLIAKSFTNSLAIEKICEKFLPLYEGLETLPNEINDTIKEDKEQLGKANTEKDVAP